MSAKTGARPAPRPDGLRMEPGAAPRRRDPARRHIDGTSPAALLRNRQHDRHYVYCNALDPNDAATRAMMGFVAEQYTEEGVRPLGVTNVKPLLGQEIRMPGFDQLLMSIDLEKWNEIQEYGLDGMSGMSAAEERAEQLIRRTPRDLTPVRGAGGKTYFDYGVSEENSSSVND